MKKEEWLIVANSSLARIFKIEKRKEYKEIKVMEHPESRMLNQDLVSDKPGRDFESAGVSRHAMEPKVTPKKLEFATFAKDIAHYLEEAHRNGEFESLYIAASPALLGLLRQSMPANVAKHVNGEIDKDITHLKAHEISDHVNFWH